MSVSPAIHGAKLVVVVQDSKIAATKGATMAVKNLEMMVAGNVDQVSSRKELVLMTLSALVVPMVVLVLMIWTLLYAMEAAEHVYPEPLLMLTNSA